MQQQQVLQRIVNVVSRVLEVDPETVKLESNFAFDLGAESIQSVELVAAFEEEFGIEMDEEAALSVDTVEGATDYISQICREQGVEA